MFDSIKMHLVSHFSIISLYSINYQFETFTMPSFMLELATLPSEKFENLRNILSSNDTRYIRELGVQSFGLA